MEEDGGIEEEEGIMEGVLRLRFVEIEEKRRKINSRKEFGFCLRFKEEEKGMVMRF
jgi:hypothetical protein